VKDVNFPNPEQNSLTFRNLCNSLAFRKWKT